MSKPTTWQRVEATNDPSGDTWLNREDFNNIRKARAYFNTLRNGRHYARVSLDRWDREGDHIGTDVWFRAKQS